MSVLPTELWAVIIGGLVAFLPVSVNLLYDRHQKKRERQLQLRREIYLEASESLAGSLDDFFQLTQADQPLDAKPVGARRHGWLNKVALVGNVQTVVAFHEANSSVVAAGLDILAHRLTVTEIDDQTKIARDEIGRIQAYQEQLKDHAASIERYSPSPELLKRLEWVADQLQHTWVRIDQQVKLLEELSDKRWYAQRALMERAIMLGVASQGLIRKAQLAARAELEAPPMGSEYFAAMDRIDSEMIAKTDTVFATLQHRLMSPTSN